MPAFDPASYPGPRPCGPVLVLDGACWSLALTRDPRRPWRAPGGAPACAASSGADRLRWSVAYGANASPPRLVAKGLDRRGAVLLPARVRGWVPAFEQRTTSYGAVPLTLVRASAPRVTATWVLGLTEPDTGVLDRSEGRAAVDGTAPVADPTPADGHTPPTGTYRLCGIGEVVVAERFVLRGALAYLPGPSTRIQIDDAGAPRCWPEVGQRQARAHLDAGGPSRRVGALRDAAPIVGAWPETPLQRAAADP